MAHHLIASNTTIKSIKPGDSRRRLSDGAGLYLLLFVKGGSHGWRLHYSIRGRRKTLSLGTYPSTGLSLARQKAEEARKLVSAGVDPSEVRKEARDAAAVERDTEQRIAAGLPLAGSFEEVAREWHAKFAPTWAESHATKIIRRLEMDVFPWIGAKPVGSIKPMDLRPAQARRGTRCHRDHAPRPAELRPGLPLRRGDRSRRERPEPRPAGRPDALEARALRHPGRRTRHRPAAARHRRLRRRTPHPMRAEAVAAAVRATWRAASRRVERDQSGRR